ncbi:MAG: carboxyl-terminal processing protease [Thermoleophilaceae bacterium]|nr:carboxyl-terminal processing protease [Thermoleophilaceae bacterium]
MRGAILILGVLLILTGGIWLGGHPEALPAPVRDALVETGPAVRAELIDTIQNHYYKPVSKSKLEDASLKGMVASLNDPYSRYFSPREAKAFNEDLSGHFEGVGMSVHPLKQGLLITDTFNGAPASKAGLRAGDVIVAVNGVSIAGQGVNNSTDRIKGPPGTFVTLTVKRGKQQKKFRVKRAKIVVPEAVGKSVTRGGKKFAVVTLDSFSSGVHGRLRAEIDKQLKSGAKGIVLDLRGNPGGLLREGVLVSSIFIEDGTVVSTRGRAEPTHVYKAEGDAIAASIPVVVLVDRGSASASEITTGALRDRGRATVVGTRTFGKGVFQEVEPLKNGGALDLTVGRYYLPNGEPLPKDGIKAQVSASDNPKTKRDEALPVALDVLLRALK